MNLLQDAWIPVRDAHTQARALLRYEDLLCREGDWHIALPRDDLELACLQLLICLTQCLFIPEDDRKLKARVAKPLSLDVFEPPVKLRLDWFDLNHPTQPFMQARGVKADKITPIQKLLIGLPEGANHAFFNEVGEVTCLGGPAAAIALFNQASNCPSFGGGFKSNLRSGGSPITTLVSGNNLRDTIWLNVLTRPRLKALWPWFETAEADDAPVWVKPITAKQEIYSNQVGLWRGLFWQSARVELIGSEARISCDVLGGMPQAVYAGFNKEKFVFNVEGLWPHPHSPRHLSVKNGETDEYHLSFTNGAPAWTLLSEFVVPRSEQNLNGSEQALPAPIVKQFCEVDWEKSRSLNLIVGGYRNKKASVLQRRHELIGLAFGWGDGNQRMRLEKLVAVAKEARLALRGKLYYAVKGDKKKGIKGLGAPVHEHAGALFYQWSEPHIHAALRAFDSRLEALEAQTKLLAKLRQEVCVPIFEQVTQPFAHKPEFVPAIAVARHSMGAALNKLEEEYRL